MKVIQSSRDVDYQKRNNCQCVLLVFFISSGRNIKNKTEKKLALDYSTRTAVADHQGKVSNKALFVQSKDKDTHSIPL